MNLNPVEYDFGNYWKPYWAQRLQIYYHEDLKCCIDQIGVIYRSTRDESNESNIDADLFSIDVLDAKCAAGESNATDKTNVTNGLNEPNANTSESSVIVIGWSTNIFFLNIDIRFDKTRIDMKYV